jgi:major intracellular serine protease
VSYPAGYDDAICVGAIDKEYNITYFSNSNEFIDFVAPGKDIVTAYPKGKYAIVEGTSFACPLISGMLLLLKQKFIDEYKRCPNEAELFGMLMRYTRELQGISRYNQGWGYPDCSINRKRRK